MAGKAQQAKSDNRVCGVLLEKVDRGRLLVVLQLRKVEHKTGASNEDLVRAAHEHFTWKFKEEDLGECEECGGTSPMNEKECPYCGDGAQQQPSTALAKAAPAAVARKDDLQPAGALLTERDLDARIGEVFKLKGDTAANYWLLGKKIAEIKATGLWQARVDPESKKPKYKSWDAFVLHELGMTPPNVASIVAATNYSEEQFRALGHRKLSLIWSVPKDDQPALLEQAERGASKEALAREAARIKREKGHRRADETGPRAGRTSTQETGGRKPREEKITVASLLGKFTVKLYCKPARGQRGFDPKELKRAKRVSDTPFGAIELSNGVRMFMTVRENAEGLLEAVVETRRVSDEKE